MKSQQRLLLCFAVLSVVAGNTGSVAIADQQRPAVPYQMQDITGAPAAARLPFIDHSDTTGQFMTLSITPQSNSESAISESTTKFPAPNNNRGPQQPSIAELADMLQWTVFLLMFVGGLILVASRMSRGKSQFSNSKDMVYVGTLPVRGQFSVHLVTIRSRDFLVATDRSGLKSVTPVQAWADFDRELESSLSMQPE